MSETLQHSALVLFSGGQDSTTLLGWALNRYEHVEAVSFDYGQRHAVEITQSREICRLFGVEQTLLPIEAFKQLADSALIGHGGGSVASPHAHKQALPASYVPNRNALLLTLAHALAQKKGIEQMITGVCQTDYSGYPDCRIGFINAIESALNLGSESAIEIITPLMRLTKAETFKLAEEEGVLEVVLEHSHTCYEGVRDKRFPWGYGCGRCPACELRAKGWSEYQQ